MWQRRRALMSYSCPLVRDLPDINSYSLVGNSAVSTLHRKTFVFKFGHSGWFLRLNHLFDFLLMNDAGVFRCFIKSASFRLDIRNSSSPSSSTGGRKEWNSPRTVNFQHSSQRDANLKTILNIESMQYQRALKRVIDRCP